MINLTYAYQEKDSVFECGFHSFLGQNRTQFSVSFFIFGLLFLLFDLEILLVYPYSVSSYTNDIYGLVVMMVFFVLLTLGFVFELGKNALTIDSRQTSYINVDISTPHAYVSGLRKLYVLSNSSTYAVWLGRFVYCILILLGIFLYIHFFSETIYCSSTNSWAHYLNQQIDYARLENALEKAMNAEIDKRAKIGATSSVVTFSDIGVK